MSKKIKFNKSEYYTVAAFIQSFETDTLVKIYYSYNLIDLLEEYNLIGSPDEIRILLSNNDPDVYKTLINCIKSNIDISVLRSIRANYYLEIKNKFKREGIAFDFTKNNKFNHLTFDTLPDYLRRNFYAVIIKNKTGHPFKEGSVVDVTDFHTRYKNVDYYHALSLDKIPYTVASTEIQLVLQNELSN